VVYRVQITGTRTPRIAYRHSLWLDDMWNAYPSRRSTCHVGSNRSRRE